MFPGVNPSQMKAMMRQMGIKQEEIEVERVIFEGSEKRIIIEPANVQKISMQGQESWQVTGEAREEAKETGIAEADIALVAEKANVSKDKAREALEKSNGDIAAAIVALAS